MKKITLVLALVMIVSLFAGCVGTPVVYYSNCTCPTGAHEEQTQTPTQATEPSTQPPTQAPTKPTHPTTQPPVSSTAPTQPSQSVPQEDAEEGIPGWILILIGAGAAVIGVVFAIILVKKKS